MTALNQMYDISEINAKNRKKPVLIVEDDFVNRELLNAYLQQEYEILCAETAEEALRITGMSRSAFHVHFQEATGLTFCQYLNDLRLATAEHLISEGVSPEEAAKRKRKYTTRFIRTRQRMPWCWTSAISA